MESKYNIFFKIKSELSILKKNFFTIKKIYNNQEFTSPHILITTWFGFGLISPMSGTWGTLAALPLAYIVLQFSSLYLLLSLILVFYILGVLSIKKYFRSNKVFDRSEIVIDEVVGVWIALINSNTNLIKWVMVFIIFRILDIIKPWPANYFDKNTVSSHSIMLDDVVAGVYTLIIVESFWYVMT